MMDDSQSQQQKNTNYVMRTEGQDGLLWGGCLLVCKCMICYDIDLVGMATLSVTD